MFRDRLRLVSSDTEFTVISGRKRLLRVAAATVFGNGRWIGRVRLPDDSHLAEFLDSDAIGVLAIRLGQALRIGQRAGRELRGCRKVG